MTPVRSIVRWSCCTAALASLSLSSFAAPKKAAAVPPPAPGPSYYGPQPAVENVDLTMYTRIREEGFKRRRQFSDGHEALFSPSRSGPLGPAAGNAGTPSRRVPAGMLDKRKAYILATVVYEYIATAEPVGWR